MKVQRPPAPRRIRAWGAVAACLATGCAAPAAELVIRDLGVSLEMLPADFDFEVSDSQGESNGSDAFDSAYGLQIGGAYSFTGAGRAHGMVATVALSLATHDYGGAGSLDLYGLRGGGGYAYALGDAWQVAALLRVGGGMAALDLPANQQYSAFSADGIYICYGADLVIDYVISEHLVACLDIGYLATSSALSSGAEDIDVTIDTAGIHVGLGLTWRFTATPWRLE